MHAHGNGGALELVARKPAPDRRPVNLWIGRRRSAERGRRRRCGLLAHFRIASPVRVQPRVGSGSFRIAVAPSLRESAAMTTENAHTVETPSTKRLERSRSDRMIAGVSGGLAKYFDIHPAFYRVGFVVLTLLGGAGILIYLAAALTMPDEGKEDSVVTAALRNRRDRPWPLIGLALVAVAGVSVLSNASLWPHGDAWFFLLVAGGLILWVTGHGKNAEPTTDATQLAKEDSRRIRRLFKGLVIAFSTVLALILIALAIFASVVHVHLGHGTGERTWVPLTAQDVHRTYNFGVGDLRVDLRNVEFPAGETHVNARIDVGHLTVTVPEDVAVRINGDAQFGDLNLLGSLADGHNVNGTHDETGDRVLVLDVHVGAGRVDVERAVR
jgi:phage shock protein PspC (stress-responsive transcriptional regulator)